MAIKEVTLTGYIPRITSSQVDFPETTEYWYDSWWKELVIFCPAPYRFEQLEETLEGFRYKVTLCNTEAHIIKAGSLWDTELLSLDDRSLNVKNPDMSDIIKKLFHTIYVEHSRDYEKLDETEGKKMLNEVIEFFITNDNWN